MHSHQFGLKMLKKMSMFNVHVMVNLGFFLGQRMKYLNDFSTLCPHTHTFTLSLMTCSENVNALPPQAEIRAGFPHPLWTFFSFLSQSSGFPATEQEKLSGWMPCQWGILRSSCACIHKLFCLTPPCTLPSSVGINMWEQLIFGNF